MEVVKSIQHTAFILKRHWYLVLLALATMVMAVTSQMDIGFFGSTEESWRYMDLVRFSEPRQFRGQDQTTVQTKDAPTYFKARTTKCSVDHPCTIFAIADMDQQSKVEEGKTYKSIVVSGELYADMAGGWHVSWGTPEDIFSPINEGGRGMELSELILFNDRMYAVDDRTGVIFELTHARGEFKVFPRTILTEGDGISSTKGMKLEWGTVKDGVMWLGSFGKEYTRQDGTIKNYWPLWVAAQDRSGKVIRKDWTAIYTKLREFTGSAFPGYMIHEAVEWSPYTRQWIILPRRWSNETYDAEKDNEMGTNKLIMCNESFLECTVTRIGDTDDVRHKRRGYSSVKILPGTSDDVYVTLRTEEEDAIDNNGTMKSYVQIIDSKGKILLDDVPMPFDGKFEGIAIADISETDR